MCALALEEKPANSLVSLGEILHKRVYKHFNNIVEMSRDFFCSCEVCGGEKKNTAVYHLSSRFVLMSYLAETSACLKFEFKPFS